MRAEQLLTLLADPTRLRALMLIRSEGELCVCELTSALGETQPKVLRHLALLRRAGVVEARRQGTWMHYRLNPELAPWARAVLDGALEPLTDRTPFRDDHGRLRHMAERPGGKNCG